MTSSSTLLTKLLVALCLLSLAYADADGEKVHEISINEFFIFKWQLQRPCNNRGNKTATIYECDDRRNPEMKEHHKTHRFDMRLVRLVGDASAERTDWTIQHISPTFEYVRHKGHFPRPGCEVDYEFINDKPFCDEKADNATVCYQIDVILIEIQPKWRARFSYEKLDIYSPVMAAPAGTFGFSSASQSCLCSDFVSFSCHDDDLGEQDTPHDNVVLAFNQNKRLGKVKIEGGMVNLKDGQKLDFDEDWCKKETDDFKKQCFLPKEMQFKA